MREEFLDNKVTVYCWDSGQLNHFSIQTDSKYISFYASQRDGQSPLIHRVDSYLDDVRRLNSNETETFSFRLLDIPAIDTIISPVLPQFSSDEFKRMFESSSIALTDQRQYEILNGFHSSAQSMFDYSKRQASIRERYRFDVEAGQDNLVQYIDLSQLILFILYQGGLRRYEGKMYNDTASISNYVIVPIPGFCLPIHRMHIRWTAISLSLLSTILVVNFFLKIENLNQLSLIFSPLLCCIFSCITCCRSSFSHKKVEKLGKYRELDSFGQTKQLLRMAEDEMERNFKSETDDNPESFPNEVRVRIWRGKDGDVGHASLQTSSIYASFWPSSVSKSSLLSVSAKFKTCAEDLVAEQRSPDVVFTFGDLNVEAINRAFRKFKSEDQNWSLLGSSLLRDQDKNCCGLVLGLLRTGGLDLKGRTDGWMLDISACAFSSIYIAVVAGVLYYPFQVEVSQQSASPVSGLDEGVGVFISIVLFCCAIVPLLATIKICRRNHRGQGLIYTPRGLESLLERTNQKKLEVTGLKSQFDGLSEDDDFDHDLEAGAGAPLLA